MQEVRWPKKDTLFYEGRNRTGYSTGISIYQCGNQISVGPINSRNARAGGCWMDIPKEAVPDIIKALQDSISKD